MSTIFCSRNLLLLFAPNKTNTTMMQDINTIFTQTINIPYLFFFFISVILLVEFSFLKLIFSLTLSFHQFISLSLRNKSFLKCIHIMIEAVHFSISFHKL